MPAQIVFFTISGRRKTAELVGTPIYSPVTAADTTCSVVARVRSHLGLAETDTVHWKLAALDSGTLRVSYICSNGNQADEAGEDQADGALWQTLAKMYPPFEAGDGRYHPKLLNTVSSNSCHFEQCPLLGICVEGSPYFDAARASHRHTYGKAASKGIHIRKRGN